MPARFIGYTKRPPRAWPLIQSSVEVWLVDQAWIVRREKAAGTVDGTPVFVERRLGPYACKIAAPVTQERDMGDRQELQVNHTLALASEERPLERDFIDVEHEGTMHRYRIEGTVNPRPATWREVPLWQMELVRVEEY